MYVSQRLFINLAFHRHMCIVFLSNPLFQFTLLSESRTVNFPKTLLLVSWAKIQYTRARFMNKR
jgi:hypothetical protein